MKNYLNPSFIIILFTIILCGCHNNEGRDMYLTFPIQSELETESLELNWAALTSEQRQEYKRGNFVIDSEEEFPEENLMGLERIKSMHIDFDRYTLLLSYNLISGIVEGHRYEWRKNLQEGVFELWMDFKVTHPEDFESPWDGNELDDSQSQETFIVTYYCTALLVNKIPANSKVIFWK